MHLLLSKNSVEGMLLLHLQGILSLEADLSLLKLFRFQYCHKHGIF